MPFKSHIVSFFYLLKISTILFLTLTPEAFAFTATGDSYLPDDRKDKSFLENSIWIILLGALFFTAATTLFGFGDVITSLYGSLQEARKTGEWAAFVRTLSIVIAVIVVVLFLAAFVFDLITGDGLTFKPKVTL